RSSPMHRLIMGLVGVLTVGLWGSAAQATILNFIGGSEASFGDASSIEGGSASGCYGDHANGSPDANGSTLHPGNGYTPNIGVSYSGSLRVWTNGFGADAYLGSANNVDPGYFTLTADPGF